MSLLEEGIATGNVLPTVAREDHHNRDARLDIYQAMAICCSTTTRTTVSPPG